MQSHVGIRRVAIQVLADHEHGFPVVHRARADELHISRHHYVSRYLSPSEVKRVHLRPYVRAAAPDSIIPGVGIEFDSARFRRISDIGVSLNAVAGGAVYG